MFYRREHRRYGIPVRHKLLPSMFFAMIDAVADAKMAFDFWGVIRGKDRT